MIDLSSEYYQKLSAVKSDFQKALSQQNYEVARKKALEASSLCKKLAEFRPEQKEQFLTFSEDWKQKANIDFTKKKTPPQTAVKETNEHQTTIDSFICKPSVTWSDIGGMDSVKQLLMETIVVAGLQKPEAIKPWKGILLFGPPGTGKTLLASAAAGSLDASFYDVKTSSLLSKYYGESTKLVSALYNSARKHTPSIIFFDEFDSLSSSRDGDSSEASRKVLSTLLTELDGLADKKSERLLLTLAATNTPWDLDTAILSRFPRRIYVSLPDSASCESIIRLHTKGLDVSNVHLADVAAKCVEMHYGGRDISSFCQQAVWAMIHDSNPSLYKLAEMPFGKLKDKRLKTRPLTEADFAEGWKKIKSPVTRDTIERYEQWNAQYGG